LGLLRFARESSSEVMERIPDSESKRRDIQRGLMNRKHELMASVFTGASIRLRFGMIVRWWTCPSTSNGFLNSPFGARVSPDLYGLLMSACQIRTTRKRVWREKLNIHGPLSDQLGSPGEPEAKDISFYAEVRVFL